MLKHPKQRAPSSRSLPAHSRNYFYRSIWKTYYHKKELLPIKLLKRYDSVLVQIKTKDIRPVIQDDNSLHLYFNDKSYICIDADEITSSEILTEAFIHSFDIKSELIWSER
jgi:hypothetical protein